MKIFAYLLFLSLMFTKTAFGQSTVIFGVDSSYGLGERPGVIVAFDVKQDGKTVGFENFTSIDSSRKIEGGWKAGNYSSVRFGKRYGVVLGADLRWRDGGPWVKKTVWSVTGFSIRMKDAEFLLNYRYPVYESFPNNGRYAEARVVSRVPGTRFGVWTRGGMAFFQDYTGKPQRHGWYSMIGLAITVKDKNHH